MSSGPPSTAPCARAMEFDGVRVRGLHPATASTASGAGKGDEGFNSRDPHLAGGEKERERERERGREKGRTFPTVGMKLLMTVKRDHLSKH